MTIRLVKVAGAARGLQTRWGKLCKVSWLVRFQRQSQVSLRVLINNMVITNEFRPCTKQIVSQRLKGGSWGKESESQYPNPQFQDRIKRKCYINVFFLGKEKSAKDFGTSIPPCQNHHEVLDEDVYSADSKSRTAYPH